MNKKMLIILLAVVGYVAYSKLKKTKTLIVNTFDQPMPNVIDISTLAGMRGSEWEY
jgi:hypothetical protein